MFLYNVGSPTKFKKIVYLATSTVLGFFLSLIAHSLLEINYLNWALSQGKLVKFYNGCALPVIIQAALLIVGVIGGYFLGTFWWRKVYVERVWAQKKL